MQGEMMEKIIFDIGSNNGDDIPYYLAKAEKVIAVEANPSLCQLIQKRFQAAINQGKLVIENSAITAHQENETDFFIHKQHHVLSSLAINPAEASLYKRVRVSTTNIKNLIIKHGNPYYVKIDIEGADEEILQSFCDHNIKPPYLSAESHTLGVFALLSEKLNYESFKLVDGKSVGKVYKNTIIEISKNAETKPCLYSFPPHSAGPFGNDIHGDWMDKNTLLKILALQGLGWKDIHASRLDPIGIRF